MERPTPFSHTRIRWLTRTCENSPTIKQSTNSESIIVAREKLLAPPILQGKRSGVTGFQAADLPEDLNRKKSMIEHLRLASAELRAHVLKESCPLKIRLKRAQPNSGESSEIGVFQKMFF